MFLERFIHRPSAGYFRDDGFDGEYVPLYSVGFGNGEIPRSEDYQLDAMGTTAIAHSEPTRSSFSAATAIAEVRREGIPHLPGRELRDRVAVARAAGSEYLNVEFGWKPIVSDLKSFYHAVTHFSEISEKYRKGSNKSQRRRFDFPTKTQSNSSVVSDIICLPNKDWAAGQVSSLSVQKSWFVGHFIYHLPMGDGQAAQARRFASYARHALGIELTPEVVWNLAPWSWAADWFSNTGDVFHNVSALGRDGLVLEDGWMMQHSRTEMTVSGKFPRNGNSTETYGTSTYLTEFKTRTPATPYGFGIDLAGLSAKQVSIIAALGLSHQGKV